MADRPLSILQVSTLDIGGGAARVAWNLFQAYRRREYSSWLVVKQKHNNDPDVFLMPNVDYRSRKARILIAIGNMLSSLVGKIRGAGRLRNYLHLIAQPKRPLEIKLGHEDFEFPGTWQVLQLASARPNIVHCHNLHGGYFDLRALSWLSQQVPVVLTLHDAWLLSGHCAHSFDCERWKIGCGNCPDLTISPAIRRDATAYNWRRKQQIYAKSRLYVTTPSQWLMRKVEQSNLAQGIVEARVIPNGVDLSVFHPADKRAARVALGIAQDVRVLLFTANGIRRNTWKDYQTLRAVVSLVAERLPKQSILFIALGEAAPSKRIGRAKIRFVPYQKDPVAVTRYYQAADVYVHSARVDTFPNTVLEALACGTPVVATAVGGIPEQVVDGITGFLVPPGDAEAMAGTIVRLFVNDTLRMRLACSAAQDARQRFDLNRQVDDFLNWYRKLWQN